jgi:hypothetical protein
MLKRIKYMSNIVLMFVIFSCSSSIPTNDHVYNNCIAFRMMSNDSIQEMFSWINIIDSEGYRYKAIPVSSGIFVNNKRYYCLFNIRPGTYYIDSAERIEEELVPPSNSLFSQKVSGDCSKVYVFNFLFVNNTKRKLKIEIHENMFKFIGTILFSNSSSVKKRIIPDIAGTYTNTVELISWEDKNIKNDLSDLAIVFKDSYWEKLILDEIRFVQ